MDPIDSKSSEPTPEQLMQLLDLQIAAERSKRKGSRRHRSTMVGLAVLFIIGGALAAFLVLHLMVEDLPRSREPVAHEVP
jgi:hypothetical protein